VLYYVTPALIQDGSVSKEDRGKIVPALDTMQWRRVS